MTRGPHVMIRYWGQTSAEAVDSSEQWFDTGDIGQIDACGNLWLVGRRNGRIKSGGENVYPEEVRKLFACVLSFWLNETLTLMDASYWYFY